MASKAADVKQLMLQVDASVEIAKRNLNALRQQVASDAAGIEGSLGRIDKGSSSVGAGFGRVQAAGNVMLGMFGIGAIGVTTFGAALAAAGRNAEEHAQSLRMLGAVLDATGNKTGMSKQELIDFSEQMENSLAIAQEEILGATTVLAQYDGVSGSTFTRSIALAADLAAVFGGDLSSNAEKLGGALQNLATGNVEGLTRGFKFLGTETLRSIEQLAKFGKTVEAQEKFLEALTGRVGGAAKKKAEESLAAAFFHLGDAIGDSTREMLKQIGVLPYFIQQLNQAATTINGFRKTNSQLANDAGLNAARAQQQLDAARDLLALGGKGAYRETVEKRVVELERVVKQWNAAADKYIAASRAEIAESRRERDEALRDSRDEKAIADRNANDRVRSEAEREAMTGFQYPASGRITGRYGEARPGHPHGGIDIAVPVGTPVGAAAAGTIIEVGTLPGYGNVITIDHGQGTITRYAHLASFAVSKGQTVQQGEMIALSGGAPGMPGAGNSRGAHVHYEVRRNGRAVNPTAGRYPADDLFTQAPRIERQPSEQDLREAAYVPPPISQELLDAQLMSLGELQTYLDEIAAAIPGIPPIEDIVSAEQFQQLEDFKSGIADIAEGVLRTAVGLEHWSLGDILQKIQELILQLFVIEPIVNRIREAMSGWHPGGGGGGGILGLFGGIVSAAGGIFGGGSPIGSNPGGVFGGDVFAGRAAGGPVSAGTTYMVGEKGPELFRPSASGKIIPNHMLGGGGSSFHFDLRGAVMTEDILRQINAMGQAATVAGSADAMRRMGRARRRSLV